MNFNSLLGSLRVIAILEGTSYLLLAVTMTMKYQFDMPLANKIVGMAHGLFFIVYCILVFVVNQEQRWSFKTNFWLYLASLLPFGTFVADTKILKPTQQKVE